MSSSRLVAVLAGGMLMLSVAGMAMAQEAGGGGGGGRRGGGGGNFDPAAMRQQMMDRMKETLGASDDEWKALQPKLEKVMTAQRDSAAVALASAALVVGEAAGAAVRAATPAAPLPCRAPWPRRRRICGRRWMTRAHRPSRSPRS